MFYQCRLRKFNGFETVSWIPKKVAKKNQTIRLKEDNNSWNTYEVLEVHSKVEKSKLELDIQRKSRKTLHSLQGDIYEK